MLRLKLVLLAPFALIANLCTAVVKRISLRTALVAWRGWFSWLWDKYR